MLSVSSLKQVAKEFWGSRRWPTRPEQVNFEITAACDAKCIHCPRQDMDRPVKAMEMTLFKRMIDQCATLGVPNLAPNGYGEICTIPVRQLEEYFDYIMAQKHRFNLLINTNGNRMNEERAALFLKHNVKLINVTIDGATAATAESIRIGLNFDQIETNIKRLLELREKAGATYPKVRVSMVAMAQTIPEWEAFRSRWEKRADYVGMGGFSSRLSSVNQATTLARTALAGTVGKASACVLPFRDMDIWADGKAVLCCEDWNEQYVVGDLNTETLESIWHGPKLKEVRLQHIAKTGHNISICAACDNWNAPTKGAKLWA